MEIESVQNGIRTELAIYVTSNVQPLGLVGMGHRSRDYRQTYCSSYYFDASTCGARKLKQRKEKKKTTTCEKML